MSADMTRVLIIDDELEFAETLAERLSLRSFEAHVAGSAEEAMEKLRGGLKPEVVILDLKMPGLSGIETLGLLKAHDPALEVILLTGHGSTQSGIEGMKRGLFDYIIKPVELGVLMDKIREAAKKTSAN